MSTLGRDETIVLAGLGQARRLRQDDKGQACGSRSLGIRRPDGDKPDCKPGSVQVRPRVYDLAFLPVVDLCAVIHLVLPLLKGSSGQPGNWPDACVPLFGLAPDGVCSAPAVTDRAVSSYLAISPLPFRFRKGGMFLWHYPSGFPAPPLAGILPGGARTFLPPDPKNPNRDGDRPSCLPTSMVQRQPSRSHSHRHPYRA